MPSQPCGVDVKELDKVADLLHQLDEERSLFKSQIAVRQYFVSHDHHTVPFKKMFVLIYRDFNCSRTLLTGLKKSPVPCGNPRSWNMMK
jgi:hypothetical protein